MTETNTKGRKQRKKINFIKPSLKYIDLFCGIGGFHQVLKSLGCKCVLACDIDKYCREVYKMNYGMELEPDVKKLNPDAMPDFDILCGGFPCQAFSNAGNKKTFDNATIARVTLISKDGDREDPSNYRPISLFNSMHQIPAAFVQNRLAYVIDEHPQETQDGFRKNRSTADAFQYIRRMAEKG